MIPPRTMDSASTCYVCECSASSSHQFKSPITIPIPYTHPERTFLEPGGTWAPCQSTRWETALNLPHLFCFIYYLLPTTYPWEPHGLCTHQRPTNCAYSRISHSHIPHLCNAPPLHERSISSNPTALIVPIVLLLFKAPTYEENAQICSVEGTGKRQ